MNVSEAWAKVLERDLDPLAKRAKAQTSDDEYRPPTVVAVLVATAWAWALQKAGVGAPGKIIQSASGGITFCFFGLDENLYVRIFPTGKPSGDVDSIITPLLLRAFAAADDKPAVDLWGEPWTKETVNDSAFGKADRQ